MNITKENLITARFIDSERKLIECLLKNNEQTISHVLEFNINGSEYKHLLTLVTLEQIHANTDLHLETQKKAFNSILNKIVEKKGVELNENFFKLVNDFFINYNTETLSDKLYNFKVNAFEQDIVKNSTDEELKLKIRTATTPFEVLTALLSIKNKI